MHQHPERSGAPGRTSSGYSLIELLVVVMFLGLTALVVQDSWSNRRHRLGSSLAATALTTTIHRARMDAIFTGVDRFVVINPETRRIEIFADSGSTKGAFDDSDTWVAGSHWDEGSSLALPDGTASIAHPLDASAVTDAWSLPDPDTSARWGTELLGFTLTSRGLIESAAATPAPISSGAIVFSNDGARIAAVAIRGRTGTAEGFELHQGTWRKL